MDGVVERLLSATSGGAHPAPPPSEGTPSSSAGGEAGETTATTTTASFIPSARWAGPREGYYFGTTGRGTGYHLDEYAARAGAAAGAAADGNAGGRSGGGGPARKRARLDADDTDNGAKTIRFGTDSTRSIPPRPSHRQPRKTGEELLAEAEAEEAARQQQQLGSGSLPLPSALVLTPSGIARATAQLVKLSARNALERATHPDHPQKFVESEVNLHAAIGRMGDASVDVVGLYAILCGGPLGPGAAAGGASAKKGGAASSAGGAKGGGQGGGEGNGNGRSASAHAVKTMVSLLAHPNADVSGAVLAVLVEWTAPDLLLPSSPSSSDPAEDDPQDDGEEEATSGGKEEGGRVAAARNVGRLANVLLTTESGGGGLVDLLASNLGRFDPSSISSSLASSPSDGGGGGGGSKDGGGGGKDGGRDEEGADEEDRAALESALSLLENLLDLDAAGALRLAWQDESDPADADDDDDGDGKEDGHGHDGGTKNGNGKKQKRRRRRGEHRSVVRHVLASNPSLLTYLLQRATATSSPTTAASSSSEAIRLHASELLSAILQHADARRSGGPAADLARLVPYRSAFDDDDDDDADNDDGNGDGDASAPAVVVDGMECLLQSLAPYRKRDPSTETEVEISANVTDALSASLQDGTNVRSFVDGQGVELMLRCLRHGGHGGYGAAKVLSFACSGPAASAPINTNAKRDGIYGDASDSPYKAACEVLVEAGGMKQIFPLFMGRSAAIPRPAPCSDAGRGLAATRRMAEEEKRGGGGGGGDDDKKQRKRRRKADAARREWLREVEGNSVRILYELTRHLDEGSPHEAKNRLLAKFLEGDCEKCDRIVELCLKYDERSRLAEYQFYRSDEAEELERSGAVDMELAALHAKLRGGGDVLHRVCAIAAFAATGSRRCHEHILEQLETQNAGMGVVKEALEQFANLLDEGRQKEQLSEYLAIL